MSRTRNRAQKQNYKKTQASEFDEVAGDTAAIFTCSHEIARDFAGQCDFIREDLESDILFNRIAHEIWRDQAANTTALAKALADLLTERERYRTALIELEARFTDFAASKPHDLHQHLEPIETYRSMVRERLSSTLTLQALNTPEKAGR